MTIFVTTARGVFEYHRPADQTPPQHDHNLTAPVADLFGLAVPDTTETYYTLLRRRRAGGRNSDLALRVLDRYVYPCP